MHLSWVPECASRAPVGGISMRRSCELNKRKIFGYIFLLLGARLPALFECLSKGAVNLTRMGVWHGAVQSERASQRERERAIEIEIERDVNGAGARSTFSLRALA